MPRSKRPQRERTHDWQRIQQYTLWPEQKVYEMLRPVVLFNESAAERAKETETAERTLQRKAEQFELHGMASLFPEKPTQPSETARDLPPDMRQLIVDLKAEHPAFRSHEIATICYVRFGRRPSHHTVQRVLASGPQPSVNLRADSRGSPSALKGERLAYFPEWNEHRPTSVYDRYALAPGTRLEGPAIIEERESTTIIGPNARIEVDPQRNLSIWL